MKLFSYKNDIVLDPFNGAGTTTLVAGKLERRFIGIDVSQQYCDTAMQRLQAVPVGNGSSPEYPLPVLLTLDDMDSLGQSDIV